jgi:hypothetical protein
MLEGMMAGMTPEEAANFYEEDEDPAEVFAWFDAGPHGVTTPPAAAQQPPTPGVLARVLESGLYARWREELLPDVSVGASNTRGAQQA